MPITGRDAAICDAALELLAEVGYDRMSMDAVAARAQASKATIYRHWDNKCDMVLDALRSRVEEIGEPEDTGSLRGDLVAHLGVLAAQVAREDAELMAGVLRAMRTTPELGDCVRQHLVASKAAAMRVIVGRAVVRGELTAAADPDLAHEVASALWFQHALVVGGAVDDAFVAHVADDVLIPLLSRTPANATDQQIRSR
ncbi:MAG: TetR/AcrR family transcriptional regulator, partial [Actinomycetes bacterium]